VSEKRAKRMQLLHAVEHVLERHEVVEAERLEVEVVRRLEGLKDALVDWLEGESASADDRFLQILSELSTYLHSRHAMAEGPPKPH